jgi:hypothetical protein
MARYSQLIRLPEEGIAWFGTGTPARTPGTIDPAIQGMLGELTEASYAATWQTLQNFGTRYTVTPENLLATEWLLEELLSLGIDAEFHEYLQQGSPRRNVVATIPGTSDPNRVIYLTGHLDSTSPTPFFCAPGADDNASGTAAVIEAARVLSRHSFDYTITFVCFNGEEQGLLGSHAFVAGVVASGNEVIGNVNADMIAYRGTDPHPPDLVIYANSWSQGLASTVSSVVDDYFGTVLEPVVVVQNMTASDHASFWAHGYSAILAIEDEVLAEDFNPWLHTCSDVIANCDLDYAVDSARALMAAVAELAVPNEEVVAVEDAGMPFRLVHPACPNPMRTETRIRLDPAAIGAATLGIVDVHGRLLRTVSTSHAGPGPWEIGWDGRDDAGRRLAPGVYYARVRTADSAVAQRIVLLH